ncbi:hypothetical protein WJX72_002406 [[Myrmecia] bisecta]|uniref:Prefoldin subunit 2 n=1 Tax=[Myrmecia] bisecta TaxID=41462 RepID=A0AAW1PD04_9CHLO
MQRELTATASKIEELRGESQEHELVANTLKPLDPNRKCFRLIGSVLVERTVEEVVPAITSNQAQIDKLVGQLEKQFEHKEKELAAFQTKYKIRIKDEAGIDEPEPKGASSSSSQGVLVSKK